MHRTIFWTWINQGTISATDATLDLSGSWTNYGTITADPSTISLGSPTGSASDGSVCPQLRLE